MADGRRCPISYLRISINSQEFVDRLVFKGLPQGAVLLARHYILSILRDCVLTSPKALRPLSSRTTLDCMFLARTVDEIDDFSSKRSGYVDRELSIRVGDCDVHNSDGAKFLGIWLDNKLKFTRQVQEVRSRVSKANSVIRYLCCVSKGMEVNTALMLYKSLVRSITDYGIFIYFPRDAATQLKLERAQYLGIRTALGYRNSTPNNVIIAEAKFQHLADCESYARFIQPMYKFSLLSVIWKRTYAFKAGIGTARKFEIFHGSFGAHTFIPTVDFDIGVTRRHRTCPDGRLIQDIVESHDLGPTPEIIFTDGSYDEAKRSTGASMVICDEDLVYKMSLPYLCTSYTAEAFAVKSALQLILIQRHARDHDIIILSDCKSVLESIYNNHLNVHKNRYITEARMLIYELEKLHGKRVVLVWIPAHVGIEGNEMADLLVKEAAEEEADPSIEVPVGDFMKCIRKETWDATQQSIIQDSAHKGIFYFYNFYDRGAVKPWFWGINLERYFVTLINRIRANHYNLGVSLRRKGYTESERCECGYEREDLGHVLLQCHKYDDLRVALDLELRAEDFYEEIDIFRLIRLKRLDILHIIFKTFFRKIDKVI
ncbi:uncharacterized protein [Temnothorax nylanderi]|uniref:uncharacterized protein isoform X2 n=1 Tax=Temnothorax nylanderi TaxID=102681 RepID=UPI003A881BA7